MLALNAELKILPVKNTWKDTIDIKPFLHEDPTNTSNTHVIKVAHSIASLFRNKIPQKVLKWDSIFRDTELLEIIEEMEEMEEIVGDKKVKLIYHFNDLLTRLYIWADKKRYFLG